MSALSNNISPESHMTSNHDSSLKDLKDMAFHSGTEAKMLIKPDIHCDESEEMY